MYNKIKKEIKHLRRIVRAKAFVGSKLEKNIVDQFHKLYYHAGLDMGKTWKQSTFLGVPLWKCPMDIWIYQEILYKNKPDLIIECGTAHGGSALYLASMCDIIGHGQIVTVDIENLPRPSHPRIKYLLGSSTDSGIVSKVKEIAKDKKKIMVILDSDHTEKHVFEELKIYNHLVTPGQYLIVEDTNINGHPVYPDFGPGPMEALDEFLKTNKDFTVTDMDSKFYLSFNPRGYLLKR